MYKYMIILLSFFLTYSVIEAQEHMRGDRFGFGGRNKMEQLEKLKLIEELNMEEETSIRFFTRRDKHMEAQRELMDKREGVLIELENMITDEKIGKNDDLYSPKIAEVFEIERQMVLGRINFFKSLNDILTAEQIAKVLAFEGRFKKEIWKTLMQKPGKFPPRE